MAQRTLLSQIEYDPNAKISIKAVDYYDGIQIPYVESMLSDSNSGRKSWVQRGLKARFRNLTKMIIDKSALLFTQTPPKLDVMVNEDVDEATTQKLIDALYPNFVDFVGHLDVMVRLLSSVAVLIQPSPDGKQVYLDIFYRGLCKVEIDPLTKEVNGFAYITGRSDDTVEIRYITQFEIVDYVNIKGQEAVVGMTPNLLGIVPVVMFHDTQRPRSGAWNPVQEDLVQLNDMYNLHITDSEFAGAWAKVSTLFTNAEIQSSSTQPIAYSNQYEGHTDVVAPQQSDTVVGGPGSIVKLHSSSGEPVYAEYKSPQSDLPSLNAMMSEWVRDFASDWSVNITLAQSRATSGFQLVVEELPSLQLMKKRQRMMRNGFASMYKTINAILDLSPNSWLSVNVVDVDLPVDPQEHENTWTTRISEGRASRIDYFMHEEGLSREEAETRVTQIDDDAKNFPHESAVVVGPTLSMEP